MYLVITKTGSNLHEVGIMLMERVVKEHLNEKMEPIAVDEVFIISSKYVDFLQKNRIFMTELSLPFIADYVFKKEDV